MTIQLLMRNAPRTRSHLLDTHGGARQLHPQDMPGILAPWRCSVRAQLRVSLQPMQPGICRKDQLQREKLRTVPRLRERRSQGAVRSLSFHRPRRRGAGRGEKQFQRRRLQSCCQVRIRIRIGLQLRRFLLLCCLSGSFVCSSSRVTTGPGNRQAFPDPAIPYFVSGRLPNRLSLSKH